METQSISRLNLLHPAIRQDAIEAYLEAVTKTPAGVHPFVDETMRSFTRQNILYAQGRTTPGEIITDSKAGQSYHNYGLAIDYALMIQGKLSYAVDANFMIVVNCFKKYGFTWGGDFKGFTDHPHVEKRLGYKWQDLLKLFNHGQFIPGATYVNLT